MIAVSGELVSDEEGLHALEPEWRNLWTRLPEALPFQAPFWLIPWWRHFHPGKLFVLAARADGRLVGLAPGYVENGPLGRRILPLGISVSDQLDILLDPDCREEAMRALVDAAVARREQWDIWELEELPPGAAALSLPLPNGYSERIQPQSACPVLPLTDGASGLSNVVPQTKRRNVTLARNRSARRGEVRIVQAQDAEARGALEELFRLHRKRWEMRGEEGVLASEAVQAFHREAVPHLQQAGLLRLYVLLIAGTVIAVYYTLVHCRRAYLYLTGFDSNYAFESPGVLLIAHAIEQAMEEGCREIDFLRGQEGYKYEWGAVDRWNVKRSIFRDG